MSTPIAISSEFLVNTASLYTGQLDPCITRLIDGGFVITWAGGGQDGSRFGIYGQRYNASGQRVGTEFRTNTHTLNDQLDPAVAALLDGGFVVTWESNLQDGSGYGVYGQRYNASGQRVGTEFRVNTYTSNDQNNTAITGLSDGGFVVTWESVAPQGSGYNIYGQRYDAYNQAFGNEFQINTYTYLYNDTPSSSSVTELSNGGFVVTCWTSSGQEGSGQSIAGRIYTPSGQAVGNEFQVNTHTLYNQVSPSVTKLLNGEFVVTWATAAHENGFDIAGQRYNASGQAVGNEFQINTYTSDSQYRPSITGLSDGGFVVVWESYGQDGSDSGIYGQRFNASGQADGDEFQINTYTNNWQGYASVTGLSDGRFIVTWQSYFTDARNVEVYAKIFGTHLPGTIAFSSDNYIVHENGTPAYVITLTRTGGIDGAVSVTLTPSDGTATAPDDYNNAPITVNFEPGEINKTVTIPIIDDNIFEGYGRNETVNLTLSNPTGGAILGTQQTATLSIFDDEQAYPGTIAFSEANYSVNEDGTPVNVITLNRTGSIFGDFQVMLTPSSGTATAPDVYISIMFPFLVSFESGESSKTITIPIINDTLIEGNETVNLTLSNPTNGAILGTQQTATLTIIDNDPAPQSGIVAFTASTYSVDESGTPINAITLTRTGGSKGLVYVILTPSNGTATAPDDYFLPPAPIYVGFADGETSTTIPFPIIDDYLWEGNETVNLTLSNNLPDGAALGTQQTATLTIIDNDPLPLSTVTLAAKRNLVTENRAELWYEFKRTGDLNNPLTVNFNVSGTAQFSNDYTARGTNSYTSSAGTVTFAAGSNIANLYLKPVNDTIAEPNETVSLTLASGNYTIGTATSVQGTILNEDGGNGNDTLTGGVIADLLNGLGGNDRIQGNVGNDTLIGGSGRDQFVYPAKDHGNDRIMDFNVADDTIVVWRNFGGGLPANAPIAPNQFTIASSATTTDQRFIYNPISGQLSFDIDGSGLVAPNNLAILSPGLAMTNTNIYVTV